MGDLCLGCWLREEEDGGGAAALFGSGRLQRSGLERRRAVRKAAASRRAGSDGWDRPAWRVSGELAVEGLGFGLPFADAATTTDSCF